MSTTWPSPDCSAGLADDAIGGHQIPGALVFEREDVGAVGLGVGELDEHHLRAIEVIADGSLQHALGLEFADDRGRRGRDLRIATGDTAGHESRDDKGRHAPAERPLREPEESADSAALRVQLQGRLEARPRDPLESQRRFDRRGRIDERHDATQLVLRELAFTARRKV